MTVQAETYYANIDNEIQVAESIWALNRLYHAADSANQNLILDVIDDQNLKDGLKGYNSEFRSISFIINHYTEEELLLYLLLQIEEFEEREVLFNEFYSSKNDVQLKEVNQHALKGEMLTDELLRESKFTFSHFLTEYYDNVNNIRNDVFFSEVNEYWSKDKIQSSVPDLLEELQIFTLFNSLYKNNEFEEINDLYDYLISLQLLPYSVLTRNMYWDLEFSLYQIGFINKSLEVQRQHLIPIAKFLGNQDFLNRIYASHGGYLYLIGSYLEARDVFNQTLNNEETITDSDLTLLYNNLSLVYFMTGESSKYISIQLQALKHAQSLNNQSRILTIYRNLHLFYRKSKNWSLATQYIDLAEELSLETENPDDIIAVYISKAVYENEYLNNHDSAIEYLAKAESYFNSDIEIRTQVRVLYEKAKLFTQNEQFAESKNILSGIISDWSSELNTPTYLDIILQLAEMEYRTGNHREAKRQLQEFRAHDISVVVFPKLVQSKTLQAKLSSDDGNYMESEELYSQTAELVLERARNSADFESGYWMVEQEYLDLFESYADFLLERNRNSEALVLLDRVKTINDAALIENPLVKSARLTEEELARERQINQEMDQIRKNLFTASESDRMQLQNDLEQLNAQRKELTKDLDIPELKNPPIWSIQRELDRHQKILHITEINDHYYVSRVNKNDIHIQKLEISNDHKALFEEAIGGMVRGQTDLNKLYEVGQILNLDTIDKTVQSLIVVADGYFHQLPLDVIPLFKPDSPNSYGSAKYAIERFNIRHVNQLSDLTQPRSRNSFESDFSGFGISDFQNEQTNRDLISLPKAPGEVNAISQHLGRFQNKNSFIGSAASPEAFEAHAGNSRILHMASHSEVSESDPLFSRLHLSPSSSDSSEEVRTQLFAYELFDLNLQNDLIMLNSCDSGAGRYLQGSGIMGISRALRYAGAQSLVLNAWSVNDQFAADFAEVFYQHLNEGESKSIALQKTKIQFMQNKNANPHYWGPYILNGSDDPLINRESTNKGNWILAFAFIAGIVIVSRDKNSLKKAS
ncbi:MAG: CHAT domain-containing protein [Balneolaceae bacterium]